MSDDAENLPQPGIILQENREPTPPPVSPPNPNPTYRGERQQEEARTPIPSLTMPSPENARRQGPVTVTPIVVVNPILFRKVKSIVMHPGNISRLLLNRTTLITGCEIKLFGI